MIDLALFFNGIPKTVFGSVGKLVWNSEVEDSASFILQYDNNINCLFSVGWVYWKNKFEFNIYGSHGFISINGLGGSYGEEKLVLGHRNFEGGKPKIESFSFSAEKSILNDDSWTKEWKFFRELIQNGTLPKCTFDSNYNCDKKWNVDSKLNFDPKRNFDTTWNLDSNNL